MAKRATTIITARRGDGKILRLLPNFIARPFRAVALKLRGQRQKRLELTVRRLYPTLQKIEKAAVPDGKKYLAGTSFANAQKDDLAIERGLILFDIAWEGGVIEVRDRKGQPLEHNSREDATAACGVEVSATERFYLYKAARIICKDHRKVDFNRKGMIKDVSALPVLRQLATIEPPGLDIMFEGMKLRFRDLLIPNKRPVADALSRLKPYHIRGLSEALDDRMADVIDWSPELIEALAEAFHCAEQISDLGPHIEILRTPDALKAIGQWHTKDATQKINEERARHGKPTVDRAFETDIKVLRKLLGREFVLILEQPPPLLEAVGGMVKSLREVKPGKERTEKVDALRKFAQRYLNLMTPEALDALQLRSDDGDSLSFGDALGILEGLFSKPGLGNRYFKENLPTPEGVESLRCVVEQFKEMQRRGSIKPGTDVSAIIVTSDLFDGCVEKFMRG